MIVDGLQDVFAPNRASNWRFSIIFKTFLTCVVTSIEKFKKFKRTFKKRFFRLQNHVMWHFKIRWPNLMPCFSHLQTKTHSTSHNTNSCRFILKVNFQDKTNYKKFLKKHFFPTSSSSSHGIKQRKNIKWNKKKTITDLIVSHE